MSRRPASFPLAISLATALWLVAPVSADEQVALPSPLRVTDVVQLADVRRPEVVAARARSRAAAQRPAIVSALDDPEVSPSIDFMPFSEASAAFGVTIEQRFPLSGVRGHRRRAAEAAANRELAEVDRSGLDVELEAAGAFWMLAELRERAVVLDDQRALAEQLADAALARFSTSAGNQADVLRAQLEVERLDGERSALAAELRAAEAMLNTSVARPPDAPVPELDVAQSDEEPPAARTLASAALASRPELRSSRADVARAEAEVDVMRSMYRPMAMVRTGPSYAMADGAGWTVMVGVSIPLWRNKLRAGVTEARAMVDMAEADVAATRLMIGGEVTAARERVAAARARFLALRDRVVPRAQQAIAPTLAAYAASQAPLVSVIEALQALWDARRELALARAELGIAWARLNRTIGETP